MSQTTKRKTNSTLWAGVFGAIMGAITGAIIGASLAGSDGAWIGALLVGLYLAVVEAITDYTRTPASLKPWLHRTISSTLFGAAIGAVLGSVLPPLLTGLLMGVFIGLMGFGPRKLLTGVLLGLGLGLLAATALPMPSAALGGLIVLGYRLLLALLFHDTEPLQVTAEGVPWEEARYVVPYEAHSAFIGPDYMQTLAQETGGHFARNRDGIGLVETIDDLRGPYFDPARIDPRIRDFYEHTSNYKLVIVPQWQPVMRPFYRLFKQSIAQQIGQANLPFDIEEAQRGIVSRIDTIDYETDSHVETLRGWIRMFEATGEAIYVGIYTVLRYEDIGYISVGFPLPESNFTATLLPYNHDGGHLLLTTRDTGLHFPGHYISDIDNDTGALTTLKLPTFGEEIEVYLKDGQLKTDHRFYIGGFRFLTLFYSIAPLA